jgi:hypothetical protein
MVCDGRWTGTKLQRRCSDRQCSVGVLLTSLGMMAIRLYSDATAVCSSSRLAAATLLQQQASNGCCGELPVVGSSHWAQVQQCLMCYFDSAASLLIAGDIARCCCAAVLYVDCLSPHLTL